jgi:hypothetical protein
MKTSPLRVGRSRKKITIVPRGRVLAITAGVVPLCVTAGVACPASGCGSPTFSVATDAFGDLGSEESAASDGRVHEATARTDVLERGDAADQDALDGADVAFSDARTTP